MLSGTTANVVRNDRDRLMPGAQSCMVSVKMSNMLAKVLIVGIPFLLSLGWAGYWILRLRRHRRVRRP